MSVIMSFLASFIFPRAQFLFLRVDFIFLDRNASKEDVNSYGRVRPIREYT